MEKIDASVCSPNEIIVSYPIFFNKNRYNDYESGYNSNAYKKKFYIGKELFNKNNNIDTFDFNNSLYKDVCTGIEIDGKDLILEDRYEYLYPNGALLCESNCTFNNTDFENERINCKCSYKVDFDLKRKEEEKNNILEDPNFSLPKQSSSNLELIKCLSKLDSKNGIVNNEAFYICCVITTVEVSMILVTVFHGIKAVTFNINNILSKYGNNNIGNINLENIKRKNIKNENIISTSNRALNNPPKRTNNDDEDNSGNTFSERNNLKNLKSNNNIRAEYLPYDYNFKYFKLNYKGVRKKIERSKLPFKVDLDTKILIERRDGIDYPENYLYGPFLPEQNILEIIDNNDNNNNKIIEYSRTRNLNKVNIYNTNDDISYNNNNNKININKDKKRYTINNINNINNNYLDPKKKYFITIRKIKPSNINDNKIKIEDYKEEIQKKEKEEKEDESSLYTTILKEQTFLRLTYDKYSHKKHPNIFAIFLTEILDKVYLVKIYIFLKKFEMFSIHLSLYLFCHLLLFSLLCAFFTTSTIKRIWQEDNFPNINFYLSYGFLSHIIIWIIYKIFICLLDFQDKIKEIAQIKNNLKTKENNDSNVKENDIEDDDIVEHKLNELKKNMKFKIIIFFAIVFVFVFLCFIYLVSFFGIYTGTKRYVFQSYYISIIEILLIKLVYGIVLASLRVSSNGNELKCLYKIVYYLDIYLS